MKALWFLPFTFACGAEGFALFAPYLLFIIGVLHVAKAVRHARRAVVALEAASPTEIDVPVDAQPAI